MLIQAELLNQLLIITGVLAGAIALLLACVGIGTPNWQVEYKNTTLGELHIVRTANFFYACRMNLAGENLGCGERASNSNIAQYYSINGTGNETIWNWHLNSAAGLSIMGIIYTLFGIVATMLMLFGDRAEWIYVVAPGFYFLACLFMLAGLAEGSRVLLSNGFSAHIFQSAHAMTMFSFLICCITAGRLFHLPRQSSRRTRQRR